MFEDQRVCEGVCIYILYMRRAKLKIKTEVTVGKSCHLVLALAAVF